LSPSANYKVTVTTRNAANAIIDGPTQSTAYTMKQIGTNAIADNSITSTKPAESLMKRGRATDNPAGNAAGWNPNGVTTTFTISEPAVSSYVEAFIIVEVVQSMGAANHSCDTVAHSSGSFTIICSTPPPNASDLNYVIFNLPPHLIP
jgi:hypothetical protein